MDTPETRSPIKSASQIGKDHAVVIGASLAGLLATRVLSDHFQRVTLIERDRLPEGPEYRPGVPQDRQPHTLLIRGEQIISRLLPGLPTDLMAAGAVRLDLSQDLLWFQEGGYKTRFDSGIQPLCMSRPLLEYWIRRRVLALQNVTCLQDCTVQGVVARDDRQKITGVEVRQRTSGSQPECLPADLVVDATGRSSKSPHWLESMGYTRPEESVVKVDISYTTRLYRQDPNLLPQAKAILTVPAPPHIKRGGALFPIEGDRWLVTLSGWTGECAPTDEPGFLSYAKSLANLDVYNLVSRAEPLTEGVTYRLPSSLRRHYERMPDFPEGYLVMGDALCSFNPAYGQGMSVSAMEAEILDQCLKAAIAQNTWSSLAQNFFKRAAQVIEVPWMMAVGEDFRFPGVEGPKSVGTDLINWYISQVHQTTSYDRDVTQAFLQVISLLQSPWTLFSPGILLRVLGNPGRFNTRKIA